MKTPMDMQRLWLHVQHTPIGVIEWDRSFAVTVWNPAAEKIFGYSAAEALGQNILHLLLSENKREEIEKLCRDLLGYRGGTRSTNENRTKDGSVIICDWYNTPLLDEQNEVVGVTSLVQDVTEQQRLEQERLKTARLESIGLLAGGIAHDFNNILTAVQGNLSLVKLDLKAEAVAQERLTRAEQACEQARLLARQLLTFSTGGEPIKTVCCLRSLLLEAVPFCLHGSNTEPVFNLPEDLWRGHMDRGQIGQVIHNLVINADQAMPQGGRLFVQADNVSVTESDPYLPMGRYVRVIFRDEGVGIAPEHVAKIYDPYFSTKAQGHGLGLATTYSVIKRHGGNILVHSELGVGTEFTLYLPAMEASGLTESKPPVERPFKPLRILFMDDEKILRELVQDLLQCLGHEAVCVANGTEALRAYREAREQGRPVDGVILDWTIQGGVGGLETMQDLRREDPGVQALVTSGYAGGAALSDYARHGFKGVLPKPFSLKEMKAALTLLG